MNLLNRLRNSKIFLKFFFAESPHINDHRNDLLENKSIFLDIVLYFKKKLISNLMILICAIEILYDLYSRLNIIYILLIIYYYSIRFNFKNIYQKLSRSLSILFSSFIVISYSPRN